MRFLVYLNIIVSCVWSFAHAASFAEYINDAKSSFLKDDHFQAARFYGQAFEMSAHAFEAEDLENFVISQSIILKPSHFLEFCNDKGTQSQRGAEVRLYCGKVLVHQSLNTQGLQFLESIPVSLQQLEYHLIKATSYMFSGKAAFCEDEIKKAQTKIVESTTPHFKDLIHVTLARCLMEQQKYSLSLQQFQNIRVGSDFYIKTLEEQAWLQFKMRNLTNSRELLGIIISNILSQSTQQTSYKTDMYFRVRYLQGYIDLVSRNSERSKQIFDSVHQEIRDYKKNVLAKNQIVGHLTKLVQTLKSKLNLEEPKYAALQKFISFSSMWGSASVQNELDQALRFLIALNLEEGRLPLITTQLDYNKDLARLKSAQIQYISEIFKEQFNQSKRSIDSIQFKSNMGQIENVWAERTEGKRTIAEALDAYTKEMNAVEEYIGK